MTAVVVGAASEQEAHENAANFRFEVPDELFEELAWQGSHRHCHKARLTAQLRSPGG